MTELSKQARRSLLIEEMEKLNQQQINCSSCPGHCCTSIANSMQTTPLETWDVLNYLITSNQWSVDLKEKLQQTVTRFRLDQMVGNGRRVFLRKTYDCPFFKGAALGCSLPVEVKPYGCLGFNPARSMEEKGESCHSNQSLLEKREEAYADEAAQNKKIKDQYYLWWDKLPLPYALLDLSSKILK